MPVVNGKKFPYTKKGREQAAKASDSAALKKRIAKGRPKSSVSGVLNTLSNLKPRRS